MELEMQKKSSFLNAAFVSGTLAALAVSLVASLAGKKDTGSYVAPINAISHSLWGEEAASRNDVSVKYSLSGFVINYIAALMWAAVFEGFVRLGQRSSPTPLSTAIKATTVSAVAYGTDYHLVPKRFTPGYETRVSVPSMAWIYGALALSLTAGRLWAGRAQADSYV
jgi:hypothetical protein